ncbi:hypothetical protein BRYFOR_05357 [Marvinbryantia formatexigens DSM 14469]|uniref:DUF1444 domain-containing protein n=2 Tax=Marvinbryantia TaxID=248744 RepID=C6L9R7_9FIRM|nr:hypothetical protein BRYFOR_05357 [Marvinbryantia formatexigens DSM 14469]
MAQTQMKEKLGEGVQVQLHQILKNNSVVLDALSVSEEGSAIAPTIYLNDFYRKYQEGTSVPEIVDQMAALYRKSRVTEPFDTTFYADFAKVKPRLACRLINREKNRELLKLVPYRVFLDLAVVVYYYFEDDRLGTGTILVHGSHCRNWGITEEELFACARENTLHIQPEEFLSMRSVLEKFQGIREVKTEDGAETSLPMYVLTNKSNYFGAASLLFDSVLQDIAAKLEGDFWVLPSSIHECIIVPSEFTMSKEELQEMVREINRSEVAQEDFLSDEIYLYRREVHKLSM